MTVSPEVPASISVVSSMRISPHLTFQGLCHEAMTRYHRLLGGDLRMLKVGDTPGRTEAHPEWNDRIAYGILQVNGFVLAGSDVPAGEYATPQGFAVLLHLVDLRDGEQVFDALAVGGKVRFPFQSTYWSPGFGALVDEFGVPWEISCSRSGPPTADAPA